MGMCTCVSVSFCCSYLAVRLSQVISQSDKKKKKGVFSKDCLLFSRFPCSEVIRNLCESIRSHGCLGWTQAGPLPLLHPPHVVCVFHTILSREYGQAYGPALAEPISLASQKCLLPAGGHKRRTGEKASEPRQSQLLRGNMALTTSRLHYAHRRKQSGWLLSALFGEALLIHPHENGGFIGIDIINEEAGSVLYQLTPQGKVK